MQYKFNNHRFKKLYFNTVFNSEQIVLENFFEAMVYLAFKFDAVVMTRFASSGGKINENIVQKVLIRIVYYFSLKTNTLLHKSKGNGIFYYYFLI